MYDTFNDVELTPSLTTNTTQDRTTSSLTSPTTPLKSPTTPVIKNSKTSTELTKVSVYITDETSHNIDLKNDMDFSQILGCGTYKCFVPSISNQTIGYLVERDTTTKKRKEQLIEAWKVSEWIRQEFHQRMTLYIDKPFTIELSTSNTKALKEFSNSKIIVNEDDVNVNNGSPPRRMIHVAQKVKKMESDKMLLYACYYANYKIYKKERDPFFEKIISLEPKYVWRFVLNFYTQIKILRSILDQRPTLIFDFQAIIDMSGNIYITDLDGHLQLDEEAGSTKYCRKQKGIGKKCNDKCWNELKRGPVFENCTPLQIMKGICKPTF